jgi:hypothetical protein
MSRPSDSRGVDYVLVSLHDKTADSCFLGAVLLDTDSHR